MSTNTSRAAAFFDVEGTLIDANLPRMSLEVGSRMGFFSAWQKAQFFFFALLGKVAPGRARQLVRLAALKRAMAGQKEENVRRLVEAVVPGALGKLKPASLARLEAHRAEGLPVFLLSAGLHEMIMRVGEELGGRGEGTRYVKRRGVYTSKLDGPACQGEGKAARARALCAEYGLDPARCYAYGDTANDIPFLALFGHSHAVDPDPALGEEARRRGWPVLSGRSFTR